MLTAYIKLSGLSIATHQYKFKVIYHYDLYEGEPKASPFPV
jgi:hypothetical protein